ncbi:hypothetical protein AB0E64_02210 [Streptomyces caelestis]|uniref:Uncharacterized protein n=1 Tax=Streptomyces caelestis TaxID=36816 RepID=A0A7W9HAG6_9ACTN|nr:hypothetical protein [Streptomyces caelestis]MBB5798660.1 hypothetical protein [Streptomyces caelestis]GGW51806.1 hypothetical protein GCM10010320_35950 [Streptomyces caelestis]
MDLVGQDEGQEPLVDRPIRAGAAFEGSAEIAEARDMARDFLVSVQAVHGLPLSARAMGIVQLVIELADDPGGDPAGRQPS